MKASVPFHPPLAAIYVPLSLYASNVSLVPLHEVTLPILISLGGGLALWGLLAIVLRDAARSAAATTAVIAAFFLYGPLEMWARARTPDNIEPWQHAFPVWQWALGALVLATLAGWKWKSSRGLTAFLNLFASALVLMAAGSVIWAHVSIGREIARGASRSGATLHREGTARPDIFYIVLDGYGRTDTFERLYGFTDRPFVEWLESKGFFVASKAHSNYVQTELSLASSLNMAPISKIAQPLGNSTYERLLLDRLIADNAVARQLKQLGYRYLAITSGFPALTFETADLVIGGEAGASLYLQALLEKTPIRPSKAHMASLYERRRNALDGALTALERNAGPTSAPRFVVVHILAPHPPFVFGPNGEPTRPRRGPFGYWDGSHFRENIGTAEDYRAGYRDQAQYVAKRIQRAVDTILAKSDGQAIVLIQGDHGPKSELDQNSGAKTDLDEAFSILSAYHVPPSVRAKLREDITPVNSFGPILDALSDAQVPPQPDRSYFSPWDQPLAFEEVTDRLKK